ncbi:unnamed protein product [Prorocentrum cordatum]|uniref:Uncharacterized protein n=1 Tax=Prorocentrum cordatum TaxID=2364126 RepID=A0ABN9XFQ5_9DINO|nr:unnamed protein product [Polarella glacialis]
MKRKDAAAGSTADDAASVVTGRRGAKKTKAEAGDAKGPKAGAPTPGTAGEIPKKLSPCARCGVQATEIGADNWAFIIIKTDKKGVVTETTMYGNGCKKCWCVYNIGFSMDGTWAHVCQQCHHKKDYNDAFEKACVVWEKSTDPSQKDFFPRHVTKNLMAGAKAFVRMRGLRPSEFLARFGKEYQELGFVAKDLPQPFYSQEKFKGVLIHDDGSFGAAGVSYELYFNIEVEDQGVFVDPSRQLCDKHAAKMLDYLTCPSKNEDAFVKLCRNASLTVDDVNGKIQELAAPPCASEAAVETPSKAGGSADGFGETLSAVNVPTLASRAVAAQKKSSGKTIVEEKGPARSPARSPRDSDAVRSVLGDDDKLNIDAILGGSTKQGHSRRRMREKEQ